MRFAKNFRSISWLVRSNLITIKQCSSNPYSCVTISLEHFYTQDYFSTSTRPFGHWLEILKEVGDSRWLKNNKTIGLSRNLYDSSKSRHFRYVNSFYFCATVASTVGYGDFVNYGHQTRERLYLIFLEFCGILVFSLILAQISNLK